MDIRDADEAAFAGSDRVLDPRERLLVVDHAHRDTEQVDRGRARHRANTGGGRGPLMNPRSEHRGCQWVAFTIHTDLNGVRDQKLRNWCRSKKSPANAENSNR